MSNEAMLELLRTRRSVKADFLNDPGPDEAQLRMILEVGLRVPDHGRIGPWRIVQVLPSAGARLGEVIRRRWLEDHPELPAEKAEGEAARLTRAPVVLLVVSAPDYAHKIPEWEQVLSVGAVCQNLLTAAHASGFAAQWLTGWIAYDAAVLEALGLVEGERVAGYIYIGSPGSSPEERLRPALEDRFTRLA